MEKRPLGNTDIEVSKICLGTMTWGEQNTEAEAFEQMNYAFECGVNFFDTAEMYPVFPKEQTCHRTEIIIGNWFKQTNKRNDLIIATKIAGHGLPWIRGGEGFNPNAIELAVDASLKRLQTDRIDLMQLHWPQRKVQLWGKQNFSSGMFDHSAPQQIQEYYLALQTMIDKGKVRAIGLSNETAWGVMFYQRVAKQHQLMNMVSIQNAYSLLRREFEVGLAETCLYENIGLLPYSPLAGGVLSGKYAHNQLPKGSRFELFPEMMGYYNNERSQLAVRKYTELASSLELSLVQLSLAFVNDQAFVTSNIIGATSMPQLKENLSSAEVTLSVDTRQAIDKIHSELPNPGNF